MVQKMPPSGSDQVQHTILIVEGVLACSDPTHAGFSIEPSKASTATRELDASISHGWLCMGGAAFGHVQNESKTRGPHAWQVRTRGKRQKVMMAVSVDLSFPLLEHAPRAG